MLGSLNSDTHAMAQEGVVLGANALFDNTTGNTFGWIWRVARDIRICTCNSFGLCLLFVTGEQMFGRKHTCKYNRDENLMGQA